MFELFLYVWLSIPVLGRHGVHMAEEKTKYVFCVELFFNIIKWVHCPMRLLLGKCNLRSCLLCVGIKLSFWNIYYCEWWYWWWWWCFYLFLAQLATMAIIPVLALYRHFALYGHISATKKRVALFWQRCRTSKIEYSLVPYSGRCQNKLQLLRFICLQTQILSYGHYIRFHWNSKVKSCFICSRNLGLIPQSFHLSLGWIFVSSFIDMVCFSRDQWQLIAQSSLLWGAITYPYPNFNDGCAKPSRWGKCINA